MPRKKTLRSIVVGTLAMLAINASHAALILDASPETIGFSDTFSASNELSGQSFATFFTVTEDTTLTGIDSYAGSPFGISGFSVTIRIFNDSGGSVGSTVAQLSSTITVVDSEGAGASGLVRRFAPFSQTVAAGSYWIGVTGTGLEFAQELLEFSPPQSTPDTIQFNAGGSSITDTFGVASIRVFGDPTSVPAPATLTLMCLGLLCLRLRSKA